MINSYAILTATPSDKLRRLIPVEWRKFAPKTKILRRNSYSFYLYDGMYYDMLTGHIISGLN